MPEVWLIGEDGVDIDIAYPSEAAAKAAVMAKFANHWTAKGITETKWVTYPYDSARGRQHLCGNAHSSEPTSNTGWFVQRVPVASEVADA